MAIEFTETSDPPGVELFDDNEQRQLRIRTSQPATANPCSVDIFCFPVDTAATLETETLVFDQKYTVNIHDEDGRARLGLQAGDSYDLSGSTQFIGFDGPMKLYCRVTDPGVIELGLNSIRIEFEHAVTVDIGARSLHEKPSGTITTPDDPRSMMDAVTALGAALKTDSPERSWPTLRGHPPLIERGEEFSVDTKGTPLDTGIEIEIPPNYRNIFAVAPLAFYLGATVRPGESPTLYTERSSYELGTDRQLEDELASLLKRFFLLDCLVRTEGVYQLDFHERQKLEPLLPWDLADLYDTSLSEQLERYLEVPYEELVPHIPRWTLTAHVPPKPKGVESLPFIVNQLGIVRAPAGSRQTISPSIDDAAHTRTTATPSFTRSGPEARTAAPDPTRDRESVTVVEPDIVSESIEHAWFGDDIPRGASKATLGGYRSQLERTSRSQSIDILVVCNDARMLDEHDVLEDAYGSRDTLPFDVTSRFGVTMDEFGMLLSDGGYDFLHYIGHATADGLRCTDGDLDVGTLSSVDLGVFFLNACHSYDQGLALANNGAFGGVATVGDIVNEYAVESGRALAQLLNMGFPLRGALEVVNEWTVLGEQYLIVGDGSSDIAQTDGGAPTVVSIEERRTSDSDISFRHYPAKEFQVGSVTSPNVAPIDRHHLLPMDDVKTAIDNQQLQEYFTWTKTPVLFNGNLRWNIDVGLPSFFDDLSGAND